MLKSFLTCRGFALSIFVSAPAGLAADVSGQWDFVLHTEGGDRNIAPTLVLMGETVTGKWDNADIHRTFSSDQLLLSFPFTSQEGGISGTLRIDGKLAGDTIKGKWEFSSYGGDFDAQRKKVASVAPKRVTGSWQCQIGADRVHAVKLTIAGEGKGLTGKILAADRDGDAEPEIRKWRSNLSSAGGIHNAHLPHETGRRQD